MGPAGLEPAAYRLGGGRSVHLSYGPPLPNLARLEGIANAATHARAVLSGAPRQRRPATPLLPRSHARLYLAFERYATSRPDTRMVQRIAIVGAGNVGATAALHLAQKELAREVVLLDIAAGPAQGKALDQWEAGPIDGYDTRVVGGDDYRLAEGAEIVVVTAGVPRKPGMSRDDLLQTNAGIVRDVSRRIREVAPEAIVIVVSNPLDVMCYVAKAVTGFPRERVLGMAGVLDTARYRAFLAEAIGVSVEDIQAMVLGGHGDTMVPLLSMTTVAGIPVRHFLDHARLHAIVQRTREGGAEIVRLLQTGSAYYAPAAAVAQMVEAIVLDKKRLLPCAAYLQGEYGFEGIFLGVPCKLGRRGLEAIVEVELTAEERAALDRSAQAVREPTERVLQLLPELAAARSGT